MQTRPTGPSVPVTQPRSRLDDLEAELNRLKVQGPLTPSRVRGPVSAYVGSSALLGIALMTRITQRAWCPADLRGEPTRFFERAAGHLAVAQVVRECFDASYSATMPDAPVASVQPQMRPASPPIVYPQIASPHLPMPSPTTPPWTPTPAPPAQDSFDSDRAMARRLSVEATQQLNDSRAAIEAMLAEDRQRIARDQQNMEDLFAALSPQERELNRPQREPGR